MRMEQFRNKNLGDKKMKILYQKTKNPLEEIEFDFKEEKSKDYYMSAYFLEDYNSYFFIFEREKEKDKTNISVYYSYAQTLKTPLYEKICTATVETSKIIDRKEMVKEIVEWLKKNNYKAYGKNV